jgi:hypothetical protein
MVEELALDVDLFISCRSLKDMDITSKSDPTCVVSEIDRQTQSAVSLCQTEVLKDNLNPDFKAVRVKYFFEKTQKLEFTVLDSDDEKTVEDIGNMVVTLGKIMGSKN